MDPDCVFCKIVAYSVPAKIEFENDTIIAFRNIAPVAEVHLLITPKKHVETLLEVDSDTISKMTEACKEVIKKFQIEGGYKLIFNGGKYQSIPHLHWHLLAGKLEDEDDVLNKT
jgi:histidine triad (HIT) family protein